MEKLHRYQITTRWTGNRGTGTSGYREYGRDHVISALGKADIHGSSDPSFHGDRTKHNPEDLLVSSLSGCHMLWYLHLCMEAGVVVTDYVDEATGVMEENGDGSGQFVEVTLRPLVTVADPSMVDTALRLHDKVGDYCFVARSVKFPVRHEPTIQIG